MRTYPIEHIKISKSKTFVFIDLETSHFQPWKWGRITEFAAIKVAPDETTYFHSLCKPNFHMHDTKPFWYKKEIQELTGITYEMLKTERDSFDVFIDFYNFIEGDVCIAHNAKFEKAYLDYYCKYLGIDDLITVRDTLPLFKKAFGCGKLSTLTESSDAHSAFDDSYQMLKLFKKAITTDPSLKSLCNEVELTDKAKASMLECEALRRQLQLG